MANNMLTVGSLFSGIGGFDLGLERAGMCIKWQCEIENFCNEILSKHWPNTKRYGDIKKINWGDVEPVDIICGGFPCQPFSFAGKQRGVEDERNMWPEYQRCLETMRPTWVIGENVGGSGSYIKNTIKPQMEKLVIESECLGYQLVRLEQNKIGKDSGLLGTCPTPRACQWRNAPKNRYQGSPTYKSNLDEWVRLSKSAPSYVNPGFLEVLMGYPLGWTDIEKKNNCAR